MKGTEVTNFILKQKLDYLAQGENRKMRLKTTARRTKRAKISVETTQVHSEHYESSSDCGSHQDNDDNREDVIPISVEAANKNGKEQHFARPNEEDVDVDMDYLLERSSCISCLRNGGGLLVCRENGCPIRIHEACMVPKPAIDEIGNFYCPYCWYKRKLLEAEQLRRKMVLAKKDLANFIRPFKFVSENEERQEDLRRKDVC